MAKNRKPCLNMANTPHFANSASNESVPRLPSSSYVANLKGFDPIAAVNIKGHDFGEPLFRLGMRLSF